MISKNLCIITDSPAGTFGHTTAALKLINSIIAANQGRKHQINVVWLLIIDYKNAENTRYQNFIDQAVKLGVRVICSDQENMRQDIPAASLNDSDFFLYYPYTTGECDFTIYDRICAQISAPVERILYLNEANMDNKSNSLKTGFGVDERFGVFIDSSVDDEEIAFTLARQNTDALFSKLGLNNYSDLATYRKTHRLYFAYYNQYSESVVNQDSVNPNSFVEICLALGSKEPSQDIDIIVNLDGQLALTHLEAFCDQYSTIEIFTCSKTETPLVIQGNDPSMPKARIFNPHPLSGKCFSFIIHHLADDFMGLTGDQSLVEGINRSALIFYQIMDWKISQAIAFDRLCRSLLPSNAFLHEFNDAVITVCDAIWFVDAQLVDRKEDAFVLDCKSFADFLHENKAALLTEMRHVSKYIQENFDFAAKFVPKLRRHIFANQAEDIFRNYRHQPLPQDNLTYTQAADLAFELSLEKAIQSSMLFSQASQLLYKEQFLTGVKHAICRNHVPISCNPNAKLAAYRLNGGNYARQL